MNILQTDIIYRNTVTLPVMIFFYFPSKYNLQKTTSTTFRLSLSQTIYIDIFTRRTRFPWKIAVSCGNAVKSSGESRNKNTKIKACRHSGAIFFSRTRNSLFQTEYYISSGKELLLHWPRFNIFVFC